MKSDILVEKLRSAQTDFEATGKPIHIDIQVKDLVDAFAEKDAKIAALTAENAGLKAAVTGPAVPVLLGYSDNLSPDAGFALPMDLRAFCRAIFEAGQEGRDILINGNPIYGGDADD